MKLESERLQFRKFTYEDDEALHEILGDEEVCKYLPGEDKKSDDEINKWLQYFVRNFDDEHGTKIYAIEHNNEVIGYGGIGYVKEFDSMEIMYGFKRAAWNKGFATEASVRFFELAKEDGLQFLIALAHVDNIPSQKVLLNTGFIEKKQIEIWGIDALYYELKL